MRVQYTFNVMVKKPLGTRLYATSQSEWPRLHIVDRHGDRVENVVNIEPDGSRSWLRRSRRGLRYSLRDVPAKRIRRVITFDELVVWSITA